MQKSDQELVRSSGSQKKAPNPSGNNGQKPFWFFLLELLKKKTNPAVIQWKQEMETFQILDMEKLLILWRACKSKFDIKLASIKRTLRLYAEKKILSVINIGGKRIYKFNDLKTLLSGIVKPKIATLMANKDVGVAPTIIQPILSKHRKVEVNAAATETTSAEAMNMLAQPMNMPAQPPNVSVSVPWSFLVNMQKRIQKLEDQVNILEKHHANCEI